MGWISPALDRLFSKARESPKPHGPLPDRPSHLTTQLLQLDRPIVANHRVHDVLTAFIPAGPFITTFQLAACQTLQKEAPAVRPNPGVDLLVALQ
jgi:hypothetical protein